MYSTRAPDTYSGIGAPRMFEVAKSILPAAARAALVITEVGSQLATPDNAPMVPPLCSIVSRFVASRVWTSATRSASGIGAPGTCTGTGVNEFPPIALSWRVLSTKLVLNASTSTSRSAWYRTAPSTMPARKMSLIVAPRCFDAAFSSSRGTKTCSRWRCRERCFHSGDPPSTSLPDPVSAPSVEDTISTTPSIESFARCGSAGQITTSPATRRTIPSWRRTRWASDCPTAAGNPSVRSPPSCFA